ncbi:MAG: sulfatase-like hydrolase/transferase [Armatimonadia bacterium]|nr:sulfatase-like hydrolase/transferase [Armatimonadia bacterium]
MGSQAVFGHQAVKTQEALRSGRGDGPDRPRRHTRRPRMAGRARVPDSPSAQAGWVGDGKRGRRTVPAQGRQLPAGKRPSSTSRSHQRRYRMTPQMTRKDFLMAMEATLGLAVGGSLVAAQEGTGNRPNLLLIMTDQQRFDALSAAGNTILHTPNLDRLTAEGVRFANCYTQCAVCGPARSSLMTGRTVENTGVRTNMDAYEADRIPMATYDEILSDRGYATEYYGKWHAPLGRALKYDNAVTPAGMHEWERGPGMAKEYRAYLDAHFERVELRDNPDMADSGMQEQTWDLRPYKTNPLDTRHGMEPGIRTDDKGEPLKVVQPDQHGISTVPAEHTATAYQAKRTIQALERLAGGSRPFSLHCSFHFPHSPMTPSEPYGSMFAPEDMPVPASIGDPMDNSPYVHENGRSRLRQYADPELIGYMIANYYALVAEIDLWVGAILDKLDELGLTENTLVIFTSDHGEMLGAHGMREKNVFYEESAHVPLLARFPGRIAPGTVVDAPVSHIDVFATICDYLGAGRHESDGASLRRHIEGTADEDEAYAVSEWNWRGPVQPNLMIRTPRWKFFCPNTADSEVMNVLYDLESDPHETNNLLGNNPGRQRHVAQGERMKALLVEWLQSVDSPHAEEVRRRPI